MYDACEGKEREVEMKVESDRARQKVDFMLDDVIGVRRRRRMFSKERLELDDRSL